MNASLIIIVIVLSDFLFIFNIIVLFLQACGHLIG